MKISEIKNEAAIDLLAEIMEPVAEILADTAVTGAIQSGRKIVAIKNALKNHKSAVLKIMAALDGVPVEEYECNILTLPVKILDIINDKELVQFFQSQGLRTENGSSGSATENIAETEE